MSRLDRSTLARLPAAIGRPAFDPATLGCGIVHLGCGAFHRAHQAIYTQDVLGTTPEPWGIVGVSLKNPAVRDRLAAQDFLYAVIERVADGPRFKIVGTIRDVLFAPADRARVIARVANPATRILSLTVTEKGYCHDPATGQLDILHPDIAHDIRTPGEPVSALGFIVAGLERRMHDGAGPLTVLCCDNLPRNGKTVGGLTRTLARIRSDNLVRWVGENVTFPSTMVDRIVPATTPADIAEVAAALGVEDAAPVVAEPFRQWVIENRFIADRPPWEAAGAELVADVAPYEEIKLRLLNGSHSALAYLGFLAGYTYIYEVMRQPAFRKFMLRLMDEEVTTTLHVPAGVDLAAYKRTLLERFANPALAHRTWQIAMDGSQKLPQRLLGSVSVRLGAGQPVRLLALAVAAWMRYVTGVDERGAPIEVKDPLAARLGAIARDNAGNPHALARAYLAVGEVFGDDLPRRPEFVDAVAGALAQLYAKGAAATVASC